MGAATVGAVVLVIVTTHSVLRVPLWLPSPAGAFAKQAPISSPATGAWEGFSLFNQEMAPLRKMADMCLQLFISLLASL